jgi:hypothetical protein
MGRSRLLVVGLGLLLALLVAAAVRGAVRDAVVTPLLFLLWGAQLLFGALPQALPWTLLVALGVVLALGSIAGLTLPKSRRRQPSESQGRAAAWVRLLRLTGRDEYSRWRLAQRLAQLAAEALAAREGLSLPQARRRIEDPSFAAPAEVAGYLRAGLAAFQPRPGTQGRVVRGGPLDVEPERVVRWIEAL